MKSKQPKQKERKKKTVYNLDVFIRMILLGLLSNPYHSNVGKEIQKIYIETFGEL